MGRPDRPQNNLRGLPAEDPRPSHTRRDPRRVHKCRSWSRRRPILVDETPRRSRVITVDRFGPPLSGNGVPRGGPRPRPRWGRSSM
jgi:hypothetical protein